MPTTLEKTQLLAQLAMLRDAAAPTQEEYNATKADLLARLW